MRPDPRAHRARGAHRGAQPHGHRPTRIGPSDHGREMTLDEFIEAGGETGYRYELARGVLEVTEIPGDDHWQVLDTLHESFSRYRQQHPGVILRIGHGSEVRYVIPEIQSGGARTWPSWCRATRGTRRADCGRAWLSRSSPGQASEAAGLRGQEGGLPGAGDYPGILDRRPAERKVTVLLRRGEGANAAREERVYRGADVIGATAWRASGCRSKPSGQAWRMIPNRLDHLSSCRVRCADRSPCKP
jgi:hypothetical protein